MQAIPTLLTKDVTELTCPPTLEAEDVVVPYNAPGAVCLSRDVDLKVVELLDGARALVIIGGLQLAPSARWTASHFNRVDLEARQNLQVSSFVGERGTIHK